MATPVSNLENLDKSTSQVSKRDTMLYKMYLGCCINKNCELLLEKIKTKCEHRWDTYLAVINGGILIWDMQKGVIYNKKIGHQGSKQIIPVWWTLKHHL